MNERSKNIKLRLFDSQKSKKKRNILQVDIESAYITIYCNASKLLLIYSHQFRKRYSLVQIEIEIKSICCVSLETCCKRQADKLSRMRAKRKTKIIPYDS